MTLTSLLIAMRAYNWLTQDTRYSIILMTIDTLVYIAHIKFEFESLISGEAILFLHGRGSTGIHTRRPHTPFRFPLLFSRLLPVLQLLRSGDASYITAVQQQSQ
jgi:hypothetical protein